MGFRFMNGDWCTREGSVVFRKEKYKQEVSSALKRLVFPADHYKRSVH